MRQCSRSLAAQTVVAAWRSSASSWRATRRRLTLASMAWYAGFGGHADKTAAVAVLLAVKECSDVLGRRAMPVSAVCCFAVLQHSTRAVAEGGVVVCVWALTLHCKHGCCAWPATDLRGVCSSNRRTPARLRGSSCRQRRSRAWAPCRPPQPAAVAPSTALQVLLLPLPHHFGCCGNGPIRGAQRFTNSQRALDLLVLLQDRRCRRRGLAPRCLAAATIRMAAPSRCGSQTSAVCADHTAAPYAQIACIYQPLLGHVAGVAPIDNSCYSLAAASRCAAPFLAVMFLPCKCLCQGNVLVCQ